MQNARMPINISRVVPCEKVSTTESERTPRRSLCADVPDGCYALKVRSSGEDGVVRSLRQKGLEVLAPSYLVTRRYSDRIKRMHRALFPGYVFVRMNRDTVLSVLSTNGVNYVVRLGRRLEPLSEQETKAIQAFCCTEQYCEPCDYLKVGQRVMIEEGLFAGLTGVLQKVRDENNVVIAIEMLHQAVRVATGTSALRVLY